MPTYLCAECSVELSNWEMFLNKKYPVGKLYCNFCQSKHERKIIKKLADSEASIENDYVSKITSDALSPTATSNKGSLITDDYLIKKKGEK